MSILNRNSENIQKENNNKFFPYEPYPQQIKLTYKL